MMAPLTSMGSRSPFSISGKSRPWAASRAVYITPVIRTRSPALSDSTSASVSGVVMSLVPSGAVVTIPSQHQLFVPMRVAFDGDGDGKRRDVTRVREDVDAERSRVAAVALGPDAEAVGLVEQLLLERVECGIGIRRASSRRSAFLLRIADFSNVPPTPTPRISGGQASGPAVLTHSMTHSLTPWTPSAGVSILYFERFSQPPPLAITMIFMAAPGTTSRWMTAGGLSPVFTRSNGERTMDARRYPSL